MLGRAHALALVAVLSTACESARAPRGESADCSGGRCDQAGSREELLQLLGAQKDPMAELLRERATDEGRLDDDAISIADALAGTFGCDASSVRRFVVVGHDDQLPRFVSSPCTDAPGLRARAFVVTSSHTASGDVSLRDLHVASWDEEAGVYRTYALAAAGDGPMRVNVAPKFCLGCHEGARSTWHPLMNELTNPWSGWSTEPGFRSQAFDELLPTGAKDGEATQSMLPLVSSASELEPIVRTGMRRVAQAREAAWDEPASLTESATWLRPMFCDDHVNYVSEEHESGFLSRDVVVDAALVSRLARMAQGAPAPAERLAFGALAAEQTPLLLVPRRSTQAQLVEDDLAQARVLAHGAVLRVRAVDVVRPVFSVFRCGLYETATAALASSTVALEFPSLAASATNRELIPLLLDRILAPLGAAPTDGSLLVVWDATSSETATATTLARLAERVAMLVSDAQAAGRTALEPEARRRTCEARARFATAPRWFDVACEF